MTTRNSTTGPRVVCIGEIGWDLLPTGKQLGGAPVNVAYHAARNGVSATAVTAVGGDVLGDEIVERFERAGIHAIVQRSGLPTATVRVALQDGIPAYTIARPVAWDDIRATPEALAAVAGCEAVVYGSIASREDEGTRQALRELLSAAPAGAVRLFDINLRAGFQGPEVLVPLLDEATILKVNDEELVVLRALLGLPEDDEAALRSLADDHALDCVILTEGARSSTVLTADEVSTIPTPSCEVVDTIGAGDAFAGAFLAAWLAHEPLRTTHQRAVDVAAFVCGHEGAWPAYPASGAEPEEDHR
ncbi:carbohydrate kinase [uncultured Propionibacterium sp.]|uniref:carbohydrate kinase family protein n=1 Tax=uncultured Propionibacterium sp. TaxID=218066 RepID=UPI00292EAE51|nr:carbohydrate kinase [uncultured Propionibacterium sp.]